MLMKIANSITATKIIGKDIDLNTHAIIKKIAPMDTVLTTLKSWFVIVIIAREFIISGFRLVASDNGIVIAASYWGKFKTVSQMAMIIVLIADLGGVFDLIGTALIWISLALTVISLVDYIVKNKQVLTQGGM